MGQNAIVLWRKAFLWYDRNMILTTACGKISGFEKDGCAVFLGVPYAKAGRFEYARMVTNWSDGADFVLDATKMGKACPQMRTFHEHLEIAERTFYHREFREGISFEYDEDCLNLNIWVPAEALDGTEGTAGVQSGTEADGTAGSPGHAEAEVQVGASGVKKYPVMIFIHGGGFDSGANSESPFDGTVYAKRGIVCVFINYRVGILGYLTHPEIQKRFGRNGNFGLDDQLTALKWVRKNIGDFGGDVENITISGQSAGAISVQYMCLNHANEGLFKNAFMISGGGKFPDFALPRPAGQTQAYWQDFMKAAGICGTDVENAESFDVLKNMPLQQIFDTMDKFKSTRKDNTYNTMPVIDGVLIPEPIQTLIKNPLKINYLLGYTNCDLYAPLMALIGHKFARKNGGYVYFFDVDAPGDGKKAFHSSDLRYIFGTLDRSWRPYDDKDRQIAAVMQNFIAEFVRTGNMNCERGGKRALHFTSKGKIRMIRPRYLRLVYNMLFGGKQI